MVINKGDRGKGKEGSALDGRGGRGVTRWEPMWPPLPRTRTAGLACGEAAREQEHTARAVERRRRRRGVGGKLGCCLWRGEGGMLKYKRGQGVGGGEEEEGGRLLLLCSTR